MYLRNLLAFSVSVVIVILAGMLYWSLRHTPKARPVPKASDPIVWETSRFLERSIGRVAFTEPEYGWKLEVGASGMGHLLESSWGLNYRDALGGLRTLIVVQLPMEIEEGDVITMRSIGRSEVPHLMSVGESIFLHSDSSATWVLPVSEPAKEIGRLTVLEISESSFSAELVIDTTAYLYFASTESRNFSIKRKIAVERETDQRTKVSWIAPG